tara:strand:- start:422 stop:703 length:282 start_codon:yes stop_codon:yes gene_type:complete
MSRKRYTWEQIISMFREAEVTLSKVLTAYSRTVAPMSTGSPASLTPSGQSNLGGGITTLSARPVRSAICRQRHTLDKKAKTLFQRKYSPRDGD